MLSWPDFCYKQVIVHIAGGSGEKLKFRAGNIVIEDKEGAVLLQHSCYRIFALFIVGEISLTSFVIHQSILFAFPIILMNRNFRVITKINCGAEGNTLLRKKQYTAGERNIQIARALIAMKINNQKALLLSLRKRAAADNDAVNELRSIDVSKAATVRELMGAEGNASRTFFAAYFRPLGWIRREPRCKHDIPNLLLDIGYTLLFQFMEAMLSLYGFDLYCGVNHTFFYQRRSLVCDLVEPFRCLIDSRIRKAHNLAQINPADFKYDGSQYTLEWNNTAKYAGLFLKDILQEKEPIFRFCQSYYRWFMRDAPLPQFPLYALSKGNED